MNKPNYNENIVREETYALALHAGFLPSDLTSFNLHALSRFAELVVQARAEVPDRYQLVPVVATPLILQAVQGAVGRFGRAQDIYDSALEAARPGR